MPDNPTSSSGAHLVGLTAVLSAVWLAWSGHFETLILFFGVASILITLVMSRSLKIIDEEGQPLNPKLIAYMPWLVVEIIKANIDVIKRIVSPSLPISPTWIKVEATQKTRFGRVLFANSITLTPGTVSIDIDEDTILVHAISREGAESLLNGGGEMGQKACGVES
jgi:multicomponent Na+:H+ antiporter subunit E